MNNGPGKILLLVFIICLQNLWAAAPRLSSALILPGTYFSQSSRVGYRNFENHSQLLKRQPLLTWGVMVGKRFPFESTRFRVQLLGELGLGSTPEDTIHGVQLSDLQFYSLVRYSNFLFTGFTSEFQFLLPTGESVLFFSAGPGFHGTYLNESEITTDRKYRIDDQQLVKIVSTSVSFNMGTGIEFLVTRTMAAAIVYQFRIWEPIRFTELRDLFPMGADYKERFSSHSLQFHILLPSPTKRRPR